MITSYYVIKLDDGFICVFYELSTGWGYVVKTGNNCAVGRYFLTAEDAEKMAVNFIAKNLNAKNSDKEEK